MKINKCFGSIILNPGRSGVCQLLPPAGMTYFEAMRCRITCVDVRNPGREMDLKIGAVTVGGSPQLAINELAPSDDTQGLRPEDIDWVNWSIFSTVGLARELQISMYNPNDRQVAVFVSVDGIEGYLGERPPSAWSLVQSSEEYDEDAIKAEIEESERRRKQAVTEIEKSLEPREKSDGMLISGKDVELEPLEQRVIPVVPTVSPYFDPGDIRFHGHRVEDGESVPFTIIDVFCGNQLLYGGASFEELFSQKTERRAPPNDNPRNLLMRLERQIDILMKHGRDGLAAVQRSEHVEDMASDPRGILTTHLTNSSGWGNISWWPTFSTTGLGITLGVVAYNPWPFRIRANVSLRGMAELELQKPKGEDRADTGSASHEA